MNRTLSIQTINLLLFFFNCRFNIFKLQLRFTRIQTSNIIITHITSVSMSSFGYCHIFSFKKMFTFFCFFMKDCQDHLSGKTSQSALQYYKIYEKFLDVSQLLILWQQCFCFLRILVFEQSCFIALSILHFSP